MPIHLPSSTTIAVAVCIVCLILLHVLVLGAFAMRLIRYNAQAILARTVVCMGLGFTTFGTEILLLGHLSCLNNLMMIASSVAMVAGLVMLRLNPDRLQEIVSKTIALLNQNRLVTCMMSILFVFVIISGLRGGQFEDDYKWASPKVWAEAGRWVRSPYRISNGMEMTEVIFTVPAIYSNLTAAHWTHTVYWILLLIAGGAIATSICSDKVKTIAAIACVPVISSKPATAGTDIPAGALLLAAYTALLCGRKNNGRFSNSTLLATGIILSGAVASKSIALAALVPLLLQVIINAWSNGSTSSRRVIPLLSGASRIIIPVLLMLSVWMLHTYSLIGKVRDSSGQYLARSRTDTMWTSGQAAGRIPTVRDIIELPIVPLYVTLLGQKEPYGGRIGLLPIFALIMGLANMKSLPKIDRQNVRWIMVAAGMYFCILGPFAIKTRFHIFVWSLLCILAVAGHGRLLNRLRGSSPWRTAALNAVLYLLIAYGISDSILRKLILRG